MDAEVRGLLRPDFLVVELECERVALALGGVVDVRHALHQRQGGNVRAGIFEREMTEIDAGIGSDANRASVLELNFRPAVGLRRKFHALDHGHVERCFFETLSGSPVNRNGTLDFTQANDAHMGFRESGNHGECEPDHQSKPRAQASVPHKLSPGDSVPLPH